MKRGPNRKANIWTARVIPVLLFAIIIYSSWVYTHLLAVDFLLNPSPTLGVPPRQGQAIVLLILYYLLLLPLLVCYGRLISTIAANPGYVPRGAQWHIQKAEKARSKKSGSVRRKLNGHGSLEEKEPPETPLAKDDTLPGQREDEFWRRDIFICNYDGRPPFCSHCLNYKLDRVHHCSEVNRCVRKMDHFCPWVGGIISETSFKFFIQFTFYTALFTLFALITTAYYFADRRRVEPGFLNVHWVLIIAFAVLFFFLGSGMFASSFQLAWINTTTVENLTKGTKVHYLAVYMPRPEEPLRRNEAAGHSDLRTITYPRPPEEQFMILEQHGASVSVPSIRTPSPTATTPPTGAVGAPDSRTFAILETSPGINPWNLGSPLENISQVLGTRLIDWFVPIRHSPCANHDSQISMFKLNPALEQLKRAAGLLDDGEGSAVNGGASGSRQGRKKRRRRRSSHAHSGPRSSDEAREDAPRREKRRRSSRRTKKSEADGAGEGSGI